jgi:succinoglycan biosynthesis transport protein ExoP
MDLLPGAPDSNREVTRFSASVTPSTNGLGYLSESVPTDAESPRSIDVARLVRKYWWVMLTLMILGAFGGVASVVLSSPKYKARVLLEVQNINESLLKGIDGGSVESNDLNIETQVVILRGGAFLKRGADRLQSDTVPLTPVGKDFFSKIRQRVLTSNPDPLDSATRGLRLAVSTFNAQPVNRTRLIELTCDSTNPDVAAQFLNSMAAEFAEDRSQSRMQSSQKTSEWLAAQVEETKSRLADTEQRLQEFVRASGNVFAGQENTLDDTKLNQLKMELAKSQADRIAKQSRYELAKKSPPESIGEVLDDEALQGYQTQIATLHQQRAALLTTLTPANDKVRKIDAQLTVLEASYRAALGTVLKRVQNDYDSALGREKLLAAAHAAQSQRVGAEAGKAAQYNALRREVEMLRQNYQTLLSQSNQASMSSSIPATPIRIVEPAAPAETPYSPVPPLNISMGAMFGGVLAAGIVFLRERLDRSIRSPSATRRLMNVPELGVIPNLNAQYQPANRFARRRLPARTSSLGNALDEPKEAPAWQLTSAIVAESFRGALASILRNEPRGRPQRVIMVTSPGPGEGKTTVVQNLGIALAESGRNVLLVDADFRRPQLHARFNLSNEQGLIDVLLESDGSGEYAADAMCQSTGIPGLSVLPNRVSGQHVSKALYSPRLLRSIQSLRRKYDMVLVDAPPMLPMADARIIAPLTDAVIMVLRCGMTDQDMASEAHQLIKEDRLHLLGTVLTDWNGPKKSQYQYY